MHSSSSYAPPSAASSLATVRGVLDKTNPSRCVTRFTWKSGITHMRRLLRSPPATPWSRTSANCPILASAHGAEIPSRAWRIPRQAIGMEARGGRKSPSRPGTQSDSPPEGIAMVIDPMIAVERGLKARSHGEATTARPARYALVVGIERSLSITSSVGRARSTVTNLMRCAWMSAASSMSCPVDG